MMTSSASGSSGMPSIPGGRSVTGKRSPSCLLSMHAWPRSRFGSDFNPVDLPKHPMSMVLAKAGYSGCLPDQA